MKMIKPYLGTVVVVLVVLAILNLSVVPSALKKPFGF